MLAIVLRGSSPNDKSSSDSKQPSLHRSSGTKSDGDSTEKKKTSSTNLDRSESANKDSGPKKDMISSSRSSRSTNDGSESLSLSHCHYYRTQNRPLKIN